MLQALGGVLSILLIVAVGLFAAKRGDMPPEFEGQLARLSAKYAIPALIFHQTVTQLSPKFLTEELGLYVFLPFLNIGAGYILARGIGHIALPKDERGAMSALFAMSNVVFIGIPVCSAVFADWDTAASAYVIAYLPANTLMFWTVGNLGMMRGGQFKGLQVIRQIFSPPLIAFIAGMTVVFSSLKIPEFLLSAIGLLGGLGTPAALMTVGGVLSRSEKLWRMPRFTKLAVLGRSLIMPLMMFGCCLIFNAPREVTMVFTTISSMPVMSQAVLLARSYECCVESVAKTFAVTTVCTLICVPIVVALLHLYYTFV